MWDINRGSDDVDTAETCGMFVYDVKSWQYVTPGLYN
jgi:hypothetical protein